MRRCAENNKRMALGLLQMCSESRKEVTRRHEHLLLTLELDNKKENACS